MDRLKAGIQRMYTGQWVFAPNAWKKDSDHIITPEVIYSIYGSLSRGGFIPDKDKDFVFLSATANIPTHESTIFIEDSRRRKTGKGLFLVGDISSLGLEKDQITQTLGNDHFQYFRWDAEHLPVKSSSVDMIWDRKGWLWHCADAGDRKLFLRTIDQYERLLKTGGSIVIDDISESGSLTTEGTFSLLKHLVLGKLGMKGKIRPADIYTAGSSQYEKSTVAKINNLNARSILKVLSSRIFPGISQYGIWETIKEKFSICAVGSGVERVLVLTKKH